MIIWVDNFLENRFYRWRFALENRAAASPY